MFVVWRLLFVVCCSYLVVRCVRCDSRYLLLDAKCLLIVGCWALRRCVCLLVGKGSLLVVCLLVVECWLLFGWCWLVVDGSCVFFVGW